jgi:tripartite-type tricarboxylate transporter receptor subunit TctC
MRIGSGLIWLVFASTAALPAHSADFYAGKTINLVVGSGAGGGFDTYARFLARFYGHHIPGGPNVIVQNMPGAGGLTATGYVYNVAPKDGTVLLESNPKVLRMIYAPWSYGQPVATPPGVPADRVKELRAAFDATVGDPALLAEAQKLNLEVIPLGGSAINEIVDEIYQSPPEVIAKARQIYGIQDAR